MSTMNCRYFFILSLVAIMLSGCIGSGFDPRDAGEDADPDVTTDADPDDAGDEDTGLGDADYEDGGIEDSDLSDVDFGDSDVLDAADAEDGPPPLGLWQRRQTVSKSVGPLRGRISCSSPPSLGQMDSVCRGSVRRRPPTGPLSPRQ